MVLNPKSLNFKSSALTTGPLLDKWVIVMGPNDHSNITRCYSKLVKYKMYLTFSLVHSLKHNIFRMPRTIEDAVSELNLCNFVILLKQIF